VLDHEMKITVVGLGVLGGSYVQALHAAGFAHLAGIDINPASVETALARGWIEKGSQDPSLVREADLTVIALYPRAFISWMEENGKLLKPGSLLTDVTGVKRAVIEKVNTLLPEGVEFLACHPMAGRESRGLAYADAGRFQNANFILVPTAQNSQKAQAFMRELAQTMGFGRISVLSPAEHDRMIGYVSQLTHVIAVSLMNASDNTDLAAYTGDSFRDLTRIANINEDLWPELFILNKDNLLREMDLFTAEMGRFRKLLENQDEAGMREKLKLSTQRRRAFDRKEEN
jgi:prephenate dehydrogenase